MDPKHFQEILDKYLQGKCSAEEEKFIIDWYNNIPVDNENQQDDLSESLVGKRIWANVQQSHIKNGMDGKRLRRDYRWFYKAAAAVLLLIAVSSVYFLSGKDPRAAYFKDSSALIEFANNTTTPQCLKLEDGSEVLLHPNSVISYEKAFDSLKREVFLSGKAFFSISKDARRPFYVYTEGVTTKVLGTSFLVKAYKSEEKVSVKVRTGKVSVYSHAAEPGDGAEKEGKEIILTPNQQVTINPTTEKVERMLVENPKVITKEVLPKELEYQDAPVVEILDQIERSYGIDIEFNASKLSNCRLTTTFSDEGLYERLEIISMAINAEYRKTDTHILISSKGCSTP